MQQFITGGQTLKELEAELFWMLQKTYGEVLQKVEAGEFILRLTPLVIADAVGY
ncbi:hypothetical protein HNQ34_003244 [Anoxybacillus tepidamans]|uniref:Uncharacterized protein n=1 Tax=Anoxybacteroides tepidamans TaxID=265948 RepID=A0A7W8MX81_9BACL|nr:hypothetical protein [Anoxybacillus tepidamans]MBB5326126.1 hypothetical protein [Anoxybacillus tepidamans]